MRKKSDVLHTLETMKQNNTGNGVIWLIEDLLSMIDAKDAALEFYANAETYDVNHLDKHGYIIIDRDAGKIANEALKIGQ